MNDHRKNSSMRETNPGTGFQSGFGTGFGKSLRKYLRIQGSIWLIVALIAAQLPATILAASPETVVGLDNLILDEDELYEEADIATSGNARAMKGTTATPDNWEVRVTDKDKLFDTLVTYGQSTTHTIVVACNLPRLFQIPAPKVIKAKLVLQMPDESALLSLEGSFENVVMEHGKVQINNSKIGNLVVTGGTLEIRKTDLDSLTVEEGTVNIIYSLGAVQERGVFQPDLLGTVDIGSSLKADSIIVNGGDLQIADDVNAAVKSLTINGGDVTTSKGTSIESLKATGGTLTLFGSVNTLMLEQDGIVSLAADLHEIKEMTMEGGTLKGQQLNITDEFVFYDGMFGFTDHVDTLVVDHRSTGWVVNQHRIFIWVAWGDGTDKKALHPSGKIKEGKAYYLLRFDAPAGVTATWNGIPSTQEWWVPENEGLTETLTVTVALGRHRYRDCFLEFINGSLANYNLGIESGDSITMVFTQISSPPNRLQVKVYHGDDVDAVNRMIDVNKLDAQKDMPADWMNLQEVASWSRDDLGRIEELKLDSKGLAGAIDFSGMEALTGISCSGNQLTELKGLGSLPDLARLSCSNNELTTLDLSGLNSLTDLSCAGNHFSTFTGRNGHTTRIRRSNDRVVELAYEPGATMEDDRVILEAFPDRSFPDQAGTSGKSYQFRGWQGLPDGHQLSADGRQVSFHPDSDVTVTPLWSPGADTGLSSLTVTEADGSMLLNLSDPEPIEYAASVGYETAAVTVTAAAFDPEATVVVTGADALQVGENLITVRVTAQDGRTTDRYVIRITRREDTGTPEPEPTPQPTPQPDRSGGSSGGSYTANPWILHGTWQWMADGYWMFYLTDGTYAKNCWGIVGGLWYCFDAEGKMRTGWYYDPAYPGWFWLEPTGAMATGWREIDGKWYYFIPISGNIGEGTGANADAMGSMATDRLIDGWYVDKDGVWDGKERAM